MSLLPFTPQGRLIDTLTEFQAQHQPRQINRADTPHQRCGLCDSVFTPGQRTTIVEDEAVCLPCAREFWAIDGGDEAA